jgi:hypothetical protein
VLGHLLWEAAKLELVPGVLFELRVHLQELPGRCLCGSC